MLPTDDQPEFDDRFPTGEWKGFFIQPDSRQRYYMDLTLEFAAGTLSGVGNDFIGEFAIHGAYDTDTARCSWTKQYLGQHRVAYTGQARERGIIGQWSVPGEPASWTGPFFIWPRAYGDLESEFERAFVEYELAVPAGVSAPELVEV
jgi:hypothetical protein